MRYRIEWIQRRCWQTGVDACDQRWTASPNTFSGTEAELTIELSSLEVDHDRAMVFRGVRIESFDDEAEFDDAPETEREVTS